MVLEGFVEVVVDALKMLVGMGFMVSTVLVGALCIQGDVAVELLAGIGGGLIFGARALIKLSRFVDVELIGVVFTLVVGLSLIDYKGFYNGLSPEIKLNPAEPAEP